MSLPGPKTKFAFVRPPIDGLNLISPPADILPTEARQINNYYIFDWGVRQRGSGELLFTFADNIARIVGFVDPNNFNSESLLVATTANIYITTSGSNAPTFSAVTGASTSAATYWSVVAFNRWIYFANAGSSLNAFSIVGGSITLDPFTGPTNKFRAVWSFKSRFYGIEDSTTNIWYGDVSAISGATTKFDVGAVLDTTEHLLFGSAWNYNQGLSNDELFVVCTLDGEVLVYQGDWPGATNWQLAGHFKLPTPDSSNAFVKLGQDLVIKTVRGMISLGQLMQGRINSKVVTAASEDDANPSYYSISKKLGPYLSTSLPFHSMVVSTTAPFLYVPTSSGGMYILNFERGAWSSVLLDVGEGSDMGTMCIFGGGFLYYSNQLKSLYRINDLRGAAINVVYTWATPFLDFGGSLQKRINHTRHLVRSAKVGTNVGGALYTSCACAVNYDESSTGARDTKTDDAVLDNDNIKVQEVAPPGIGRQISFVMQETPGVEHTLNERLGFEVSYEEGGVY